MRALVAYAPAVVLLALGLVVVATTPVVTPVTCSCSTGPNGDPFCPPCPSGFEIHLLAPALLAGAVGLAVVAFAARRRSSRAVSAPAS